MMSGEDILQLRVTARSRSFRRAGMAFGHEPIILLLCNLTLVTLGLLVNESELICELGDGERFRVIEPADLVDMQDTLAKFMTGTGEEGGADSQTPLEPSLASDAAAATGDDASQTATEAATPPSGEEQPAADAAPAPVAAPASEPEKPSGRAPKAAKPKASEAKAAS
ncbi:hypothetical protein C7451_10158 [Blastomonas natatoria]|uniref:Mu-like prophage FluMu N-terminal domain-containing protein n=2 Tax=Blastomonas natatoria TaxID=34015 RepID=A0A2V3VB05_9SPHN|nr:hypothetical protein C7451_10158 [Blastomonas natatoria]